MFDNLKKKVLNALNLEEKKKEKNAESEKSAEKEVFENPQPEKMKNNAEDCVKCVSEKIEQGATVVGETLKSGCEAIADSKVVEYGGKTIDAAGEVVEKAGKKVAEFGGKTIDAAGEVVETTGKKVVETGKKIINSDEVKEVKQTITNIGNNIDDFAQKQIDNIKEKIKNFNNKGE